MNWEAVTALSTALTGAVILITAVAGVAQLRQLRAQRRDTAAVELVRSFQDVTFAQVFPLIISLPSGLSASDFRSLGGRYEEAAQILGMRFELLGMLVHRRAISFDVAQDLAGGACIGIWHRLKDAVTDLRQEQSYPMYFEWFQWLAEQFEKHGKLGQTPAHLRFVDWDSMRR